MTEANEEPDPIEIYRVWALCDLWPLEDAVALVLGNTPRKLGSEGPQGPTSKGARVIYELALNCAGHTLQLERSEARDGQLMVEPRMFVAWFEQRAGEIPPALRQALGEARDAVKEGNGTRRASLRPDQKHRERTRGVAQYLWQHDPTIRIGTMTDYRELWAITCDGNSYSRDTIYEWLKEVAPPDARKPGAPPKNPPS
jgi:hypothetical protein